MLSLCVRVSESQAVTERMPALVVNVGVAKSGTTSLFEYFECSGWRSTHDAPCGWERCSTALNRFLNLNMSKHVSPEAVFRNVMGGAYVYTELNAARQCEFPQLDHVEHLIRSLPSACFVLTSRNPTHWVTNMHNYHAPTKRDSLATEMLRACAARGKWPRAHADLEEWYGMHLRRAREAMLAAPCALEVAIERPVEEVGALLARRFAGTNSSCWARAHATP